MIIAGIDEVGRGCLAGAVVASAVILDPSKPIPGLTDSKKLTPSQRLLLAQQIRDSALCWTIARAEASEVDQLNVLQASLLAMQRAYKLLSMQPDKVLVDGKFFPAIACAGEAIIKGDLLIPAISAASILAKVARDNEMQCVAQIYPGYAFEQHKGYPTSLHLLRLQLQGLSPIHRKSFAPIKKYS